MDDEACWYCGKPRDETFEIEHQTPRSRGGANSAANIVAACRRCNNIKSNRTVEEFRELIAGRLSRTVAEIRFFGESSEPCEIPKAARIRTKYHVMSLRIDTHTRLREFHASLLHAGLDALPSGIVVPTPPLTISDVIGIAVDVTLKTMKENQ